MTELSAFETFIKNLDEERAAYAYRFISARAKGLDAPETSQPWGAQVRQQTLEALRADRNDPQEEVTDHWQLLGESADGVFEKFLNKLVDTSTRNRLLSFKEYKSSSLVLPADAHQLWKTVEENRNYFLASEFLADGTRREPKANVTLIPGQPFEVERRLTPLSRAAKSNLTEKGLHTLYLSLGCVEWEDEKKTKTHQAPLLLLPVSLVVNRQRQWAVKIVGEASLNAAFKLLLENKHQTQLPNAPLESGEYDDFIFKAKEALPQGMKLDSSWSALMIASFAKEVMHQELTDNRLKVNSNKIVKALTQDQTLTLDETQPFRPHPVLALDADPSQQEIIESSLRGESFVMFGPPGTGKSQTISNLIIEHMRAGKKVLFVSEKKAALEAVHDRLLKTGLDAHALVLHGTNIDRKETANSFLGVINQTLPAFEDLTGELKNKEEKLNKYGLSLNQTCPSNSLTAYQIYGKQIRLEESLRHKKVPLKARPSSVDITLLNDEELKELSELGWKLEEVWEDWQEGNPWGKINPLIVVDQDLTLTRHQIAEVSKLIFDINQDVKDEGERLGFENFNGKDLPYLVELLKHITQRPQEVNAKITRRGLTGLELMNEYQQKLTFIKATNETILRAWDGELELAVARETEGLFNKLPSSWGWDKWTSEESLHLLQMFVQAKDALKAVKNTSLQVNTLEDVRTLSAIFACRQSVQTYNVSWLRRDIFEQAQKGALELEKAIVEETKAREKSNLHFNDKVTEENFLKIVRKTEGKQKLSLFSEKELRKQLRAYGIKKFYRKTLLTHLQDAKEYHNAYQRRVILEKAYAETLEGFYLQEATDFTRLRNHLDAFNAMFHHLTSNPGMEQQLKVLFETDATEQAAVLDAWKTLKGNYFNWKEENFQDVLTKAEEDYKNFYRLVELLKPKNSLVSWGQLQDVSRQTTVKFLFEEEIQDEKYSFFKETLPAGAELEALERIIAWEKVLVEVFKASGDVFADITVGEDDIERVYGWMLKWEEGRHAVKSLTSEEHHKELDEVFSVTGQTPSWLTDLAQERVSATKWRDALFVIDKLSQAGHSSLLGQLRDEQISSNSVKDVFFHALYTKAADLFVAKTTREGGKVDGQTLKRIIKDYQQLEAKIQAEHSALHVRQSIMGRWELMREDMLKVQKLLTREANKKTRHKHLRELFSEHDYIQVAQTLKPCFMMSPLAVSQYLPSDVTFDVVVFDEASQIRPEDALVALYRAEQVVIAGDSKQMPPSDFFTQSSENDEIDAASLLDLAQGSISIKTRPLRWHYRSQHENLICFSARRYYKGENMVIFPSPQPSDPFSGVKFHHVKGVFERAAARVNRKEAETVVEMVVENHALRPQESMGIVTMNAEQATLIEDLLEDANFKGKLNIDFDDPISGVFVKNLENVQGDERDVMFLSIGYGPDKNGLIPSNFGPLSRRGGERRLNVAVTRARKRLHVISSLTAQDIPDRLKGATELKAYLQYAQGGSRNIYTQGEQTGDEFKETINQWLIEEGFNTQTNLSVDGFAIDIAVKDQRNPSRFTHALEIDFHAFKQPQTRTRERLIPQVLKRQGWKHERLWVVDWVRDSSSAKKRLLEVLKN